MKVGIIGAGVGGLATAIRLAVKGHDVTVYEKNAHPGGKIAEIHKEGFRFDCGPSLFTMPELTEALFSMCGEQMKEHIPYFLIEKNCNYFYPDGSNFVFYHDKAKLAAELEAKQITNPESLFKRLSQSKEVYEMSAPVFLFSDFHKLANFNTPPYRNIATKLFKLDFLRTMHGANKHDFKDNRLIKIFDRYATYNGSNPYRAPATLNMITHLENNIGAFFPEKGIYSIAKELCELAQRNHVRFRFETKVEAISVEAGNATGVVVNGVHEAFDLLVSDVDVKYLANNLIADYPLKGRVNWAEPSSSALIFYWGIDREYPELDLHNILFSDDYKAEFDTLFKQRSISDDPTIYICVSSKRVEGDAPKGCENWFVMVNAPSNQGQQWESLIARTRKNIISKINKTLGTNIEQHIVQETIGSPLTIQQETMSAGGALYGASSNSAFSAFLRHPNSMSAIKNLYFVGGSVHPGGGIPLCIASSMIVCDEIGVMYGR